MTESERRIWVLISLIVCLLAGFGTGRSFFFSIAYLFAALLIGSWIWSQLAMTGLKLGRRTPARQAQVGQTFEETLTIANTGWLPKLWIEVRDASSLPGHQVSRVIPGLLPRGRRSWVARTVCKARGQFTLGPVTLVSGDPFGLFKATRQLPATASVLVYPMTVPITSFSAIAGDMSGGDSDRRRTHFVTTNAAGVREYMPGDSLNRIHWKSSARRGQLLVKEFEVDPQGDVWLWLDISATSLVAGNIDRIVPGGPSLPARSDEYAIAMAASLAQYFLLAERSVGLITHCPDRVILPPDRGGRQLARVMETLARADSDGALPLSQALPLDGHLPGRGAAVVLITADQSPEWGAEAYAQTRRGLRVFTMLLDPFSFDGSHPADEQANRLAAVGVGTRIVRYGDNLSAALSL